MIRRPPRSTHCISSAASDVYKRQVQHTLCKNSTAKWKKLFGMQKREEILFIQIQTSLINYYYLNKKCLIRVMTVNKNVNVNKSFLNEMRIQNNDSLKNQSLSISNGSQHTTLSHQVQQQPPKILTEHQKQFNQQDCFSHVEASQKQKGTNKTYVVSPQKENINTANLHIQQQQQKVKQTERQTYQLAPSQSLQHLIKYGQKAAQKVIFKPSKNNGCIQNLQIKI
eukprot:TRINITY_DN33363_c0_g1_i1.p1 TRINITY_DN33363_c0_g1~~TRINITY_DN33363_c0_g1_i1.p1  ORF type:complete len:225 (-),score=42.47 TRINITY_DN33363_c0_g1_i1:203-877(-)